MSKESHLQPSLPILYNTETRKKELLKPMEEGHVKLYTCGPTLYNYAHIGNFRTYIFEDLLRRTLKYFGLKVTQVMNLTDVDDKTIRGAIAKGVSLEEYTKPFEKAFFEDLRTLNIEPVEHYPAATQYIDQMISMIEVLLKKGFAYKGSDGSIYYSIGHFSRYGCLSHLKLDELKAGASQRVASDEYEKEHIADFVLWKSYDVERDGEIFWESPFGRGRPGWHLECSAMAMSILGERIDIHIGGVDNMFPHHENEIAQSEAYSGNHFVNLWMHSEHLLVDNKKMSKSLGNFYTLRDLLSRGYSGIELRYMLMQTHYKTQLNFTFAGLDAVKNSLQRLRDFIQRLGEIAASADNESISSRGEVMALGQKAVGHFSSALADDLNISAALAAIFELIREVNNLADRGGVTAGEARTLLQHLRSIDSVLGVLFVTTEEEAPPPDLLEALEMRSQARREKNWALADSLRDKISASGYLIEDTAHGARLKKN